MYSKIQGSNSCATVSIRRPDYSAIRDHCFNSNHEFRKSNVYFLDSTAQLLNFRILESIHIKSNRPEINNKKTATIINILDAVY